MNQQATNFLKSKFYSGQITGEELMRRVEAEVRREIASEMEQLRGERDETAEALRTEKLRIDTLEVTLRNCPDVTVGHNDDSDEGPVGYFIEVDGCEPWAHVGKTFRECLDAHIAEVIHTEKAP